MNQIIQFHAWLPTTISATTLCFSHKSHDLFQFYLSVRIFNLSWFASVIFNLSRFISIRSRNRLQSIFLWEPIKSSAGTTNTVKSKDVQFAPFHYLLEGTNIQRDAIHFYASTQVINLVFIHSQIHLTFIWVILRIIGYTWMQQGNQL